MDNAILDEIVFGDTIMENDAEIDVGTEDTILQDSTEDMIMSNEFLDELVFSDMVDAEIEAGNISTEDLVLQNRYMAETDPQDIVVDKHPLMGKDFLDEVVFRDYLFLDDAEIDAGTKDKPTEDSDLQGSVMAETKNKALIIDTSAKYFTIVREGFPDEIVFVDDMEDGEITAETKDMSKEDLDLPDRHMEEPLTDLDDIILNDPSRNSIEDIAFLIEMGFKDILIGDEEIDLLAGADDATMKDIKTSYDTAVNSEQDPTQLSPPHWQPSEKAFLLDLYYKHGMKIDDRNGQPIASYATHINAIKDLIHEAPKHRVNGELYSTDPWPVRIYSLELGSQVSEQGLREDPRLSWRMK